MYHLLVEEHLGCFQFLVIMCKATINTCVKVFMWHKLSFLLGKIPRNRIARSDGKSIFNIIYNCQQCHFAFLSAI